MDIRIRPLETLADFQACVALQEATWGQAFAERVPASLLLVATRLGGVVAGAFDATGRLVGFVFGLTGIQEGRLVHWSDMLAVAPELRDRGLGERLKRFQRERLLPLGVEAVYWTFDPLESRNAYLNFARLGIVVREYHQDVYGHSDSPLHAGIGTDRLVALWRIAGERALRRLAGEDRPPSAGDVASIPLVNETRSGPGGLASLEPDLGIAAPAVRIAIPADIQALKTAAPGLALDWRVRTRAAFEAYLGRGYEARELVREGERSCYVLAERRALAS